jgi:hypothetical protein
MPFNGEDLSKATTVRRQRHYSDIKASAVRRQRLSEGKRMNCKTVTSKHSLFSQSLDALPENLGRRMLQRLSSLKHYMCSVGLKEKSLRWQRQRALWRQKPFNGNGPSLAKALRWPRQGPFDGKGPTVAKARALWRQRPINGKGCNKKTSSFLTITRVLVLIGFYP